MIDSIISLMDNFGGGGGNSKLISAGISLLSVVYYFY